MQAKEIKKDIYWVGVKDWNLREFHGYATPHGSTYNSYLIMDEKITLVDGVKSCMSQEMTERVKSVVDFSQISYVVVNHVEMDHSGNIPEIMKLAPQAVIITDNAGKMALEAHFDTAGWNYKLVTTGESVSIGKRSLTFMTTPMLHWPDSMFTWVKEANTLFTCDFLGCHYCEPYTFDTRIAYPKAYDTALELYYGAIFGPFASFVRKGLEKIKALPQQPDYICTSHGPVLTKEGRMQQVLASYEAWSAEQPAGAELIPVFYTSAYGNTAKLAKKIQEGILEAKPDADCQTYDIIEHDMAQLHALINHCKAFAVGSPTLNRDAVPPVWNLLAGVDAINSGKKPALVFGSYGWTGEAVGNIQARLQGLKMNVFEDGFKVAFVPTEDDLEAAKELGKNFAMSF